ncbi:MAG: hypothetical protein NTZ32_23940 [Planctomycetales bacterium]|nr:hypothetical protein [Planctomycetales bacterium]
MMSTLAPPAIRRFPPGKQRRMDELLDKNREGTITEKELSALQRLVADAESLAITNGKKLAEFAKRVGNLRPANSVPVTVWVTPIGVEP